MKVVALALHFPGFQQGWGYLSTQSLAGKLIRVRTLVGGRGGVGIHLASLGELAAFFRSDLPGQSGVGSAGVLSNVAIPNQVYEARCLRRWRACTFSRTIAPTSVRGSAGSR